MSSIQLRGVHVEIPLLGRSDYNLKRRLVKAASGKSERPKAIRALAGIDLKITDGARVALVGSNGSGKTTLLRTMAQTLAPTAGSVELTGSVSSMLDGNLGIDIEATGYQNIVMKSLVLGLSRSEINEKKEGIAEFTGLGERLHHPVHTYSSGMAARLTFSIATAIDPDILLLDEGIGTADDEFTVHAHRRLQDFMGKAGILVLASHSRALIDTFCETAIWLDKGHIVAHGAIPDVFERISEAMATKSTPVTRALRSGK